MNRDFIDAALSDEPGIEPDADFADSVMAALRHGESHQPLAFPWLIVGAGLTGIAATTAAIVWTQPLVPPTVQALGPLTLSTAALLGSWGCYAAAARLVRVSIE